MGIQGIVYALNGHHVGMPTYETDTLRPYIGVARYDIRDLPRPYTEHAMERGVTD